MRTQTDDLLILCMIADILNLDEKNVNCKMLHKIKDALFQSEMDFYKANYHHALKGCLSEFIAVDLAVIDELKQCRPAKTEDALFKDLEFFALN